MLKTQLAYNEAQQIKGLLAIYQNQTADEKISQSTNKYNGIGFTGADARRLTQAAQWWKSHQYFTEKQKAYFQLGKRMPKYAGQLINMAIANGVWVQNENGDWMPRR